MRKVNSIYNRLNNKKKAFTLIELLIVIAIIGILFIVLVSKVDFATDKAKATGVQTDFRSFQMAFDTVAKENAGFNTFGFDTGDNAGTIPTGYAFVNEDAQKATMGDGVRNSYDEGDKNLNGKQDINGKDGYTGTTEVFTGRKIYTEKWTDIWTLVNPADTAAGYDADAIFALESAINKNLDPKLHITIAADGKITMANQARDPWKNEYHGYYITNAETDKGDRGAIVMYSNGANGKWGSAHDITNGVVSVTVPGNNVNGKDDYSFVSCYTFTNGYGEVLNLTTGFSNNQSFNGAGMSNTPSVVPGDGGNNAGGNAGGNGQPETPSQPSEPIEIDGGLYADKECTQLKMSWEDLIGNNIIEVNPNYIKHVGDIDGVLVFPTTLDVDFITGDAFKDCVNLTGIIIQGNVGNISQRAFYGCTGLEFVYIYSEMNLIDNYAFYNCTSLTEVVLPSTITEIMYDAFSGCSSLTSIDLSNITSIGFGAFQNCTSLSEVNLCSNLNNIGKQAFKGCTSLVNVTIPELVPELNNTFYNCTSLETVILMGPTKIGEYAFYQCTKLKSVSVPEGSLEIGNYAFYKCSALTSFDMPSTISSVGNQAFNRAALTAITLPDGLQTIGEYAFMYCPITSISIPSSVTSIDEGAFQLCERLTTVVLHEGLISIGRKAFSSTSFNEITLPSTLTSIGEEAFSYSKITSIIIPEGITEIPDGLFESCRAIKYVNVLGRITSIGKDAFVNAINLEYIYIPNSVLNIGELAFGSGVNNFEIHYEGTETEWNSITKPDNWNNSVYCTMVFNA